MSLCKISVSFGHNTDFLNYKFRKNSENVKDESFVDFLLPRPKTTNQHVPQCTFSGSQLHQIDFKAFVLNKTIKEPLRISELE